MLKILISKRRDERNKRKRSKEMNRSLVFGKLIKDYRKKKGITQEEFGKKLNKSKSFVSRLEKKDSIVDTNKPRALVGDISRALKLNNTQRLKLEISSGILPSALLDCLKDEQVVGLFADLADPSLSKDERKKRVDELNISLGFLRHFIIAEILQKE